MHPTVIQGLLRGGARVWNPQSRQKEQMELQTWWRDFVLSPVWSTAQRLLGSRSLGGSAPRLVVVFFCKYGRHRSVALHSLFVFIVDFFKWLRLVDAAHLSSSSWGYTTCQRCQAVCMFWCAVLWNIHETQNHQTYFNIFAWFNDKQFHMISFFSNCLFFALQVSNFSLKGMPRLQAASRHNQSSKSHTRCNQGLSWLWWSCLKTSCNSKHVE